MNLKQFLSREDTDDKPEDKTPLVDLLYKKNELENEGNNNYGSQLLEDEIKARITEFKDSADDGMSDDFSSDGSDDENVDEATDEESADSENTDESDTDSDEFEFSNESYNLAAEGWFTDKLKEGAEKGLNLAGRGIKAAAKKGYEVGAPLAVKGAKYAGNKAQGLLVAGLGASVDKLDSAGKSLIKLADKTPEKFIGLNKQLDKLLRTVKTRKMDFEISPITDYNFIASVGTDDTSSLKDMLINQIKLRETLNFATIKALNESVVSNESIADNTIRAGSKLKSNLVYEDPTFQGVKKGGDYTHPMDGMVEYHYEKKVSGNFVYIILAPENVEDINKYSELLEHSMMTLVHTKSESDLSKYTFKNIREVEDTLLVLKKLVDIYVGSKQYYSNINKLKGKLKIALTLKEKLASRMSSEINSNKKEYLKLIHAKVDYYDKTFINGNVALQNKHYNVCKRIIAELTKLIK